MKLLLISFLGGLLLLVFGCGSIELDVRLSGEATVTHRFINCLAPETSEQLEACASGGDIDCSTTEDPLEQAVCAQLGALP